MSVVVLDHYFKNSDLKSEAYVWTQCPPMSSDFSKNKKIKNKKPFHDFSNLIFARPLLPYTMV
jgi:hypothetical protein